MMRMTLEPGIVDLNHAGMTLEVLRELGRALRLVPDAQRERLEPALEQEARVRIERAAEMVELVLDLGDPRRGLRRRP
jgi:hypothetical protein